MATKTAMPSAIDQINHSSSAINQLNSDQSTGYSPTSINQSINQSFNGVTSSPRHSNYSFSQSLNQPSNQNHPAINLSKLPAYPCALPSYPEDFDFNDNLPCMYGGARKGAKPYQEDSFFSYQITNSPTNQSTNRASHVKIGGVFDGHGGLNGLIASCTARDYSRAYFQSLGETICTWTVEDWRENLRILFAHMHEAIRTRFLTDSTPQSKRYCDERGIVRASNGDPVHGGTTASIVVTIEEPVGDQPHLKHATVICANVGDSTSLLMPTHGDYSFLSVDHGPENADEYVRINFSLPSPSDMNSNVRLLFVYDKTNTARKFDCPLVFKADGTKDPIYQTNPWGNGLHPTNVRYEPAVYAVSPRSVTRDSTCIAMTRALGDFYAHQFGLTHEPSINVHRITIDTSDNPNPQYPSSYSIIVASDGIWDCWKYEDLHAYMTERLIDQDISLPDVGEITLDESMRRAIANFGSRHYDDACLVTWQFK